LNFGRGLKPQITLIYTDYFLDGINRINGTRRKGLEVVRDFNGRKRMNVKLNEEGVSNINSFAYISPCQQSL
jgi:transposase